jgi:hypothetical protein
MDRRKWDCAAPKILQAGGAGGYKIAAISERWYSPADGATVTVKYSRTAGGVTRVEPREFHHGESVPSCETCHAPLHGPQVSPSTADDSAALSGNLGFHRLAYPRRCMLFERADAAIELYRLPDRPGCSFRVGFSAQDELRRFEAALIDHTTAVSVH